MKLLQLHAEFKLSDDFDGGLADAIIELGEYLKTQKAIERIASVDLPDISVSRAEWERAAIRSLVALNHLRGNRWVGAYYLGDWSDKL